MKRCERARRRCRTPKHLLGIPGAHFASPRKNLRIGIMPAPDAACRRRLRPGADSHPDDPPANGLPDAPDTLQR